MNDMMLILSNYPLQGYCIDFVAMPHQESQPTHPHYTLEQVALIQEEISKLLDMIVDSDASLQGWGACCGIQTTRGAWLQEEATLHINCLELLAATIAVQSFAKHKYKLNILLRIDNTTAVISTIWGRLSQETWSI